MHDITTLDMGTLIDILSEHTAIYSRLLAEKDFSSEKFAESKFIIKSIQEEIEKRKKFQTLEK